MKKIRTFLVLTSLLCALASCGKENDFSSKPESASNASTSASTTAEAETAATTAVTPTATADKTESTTAEAVDAENTEESADLSGYWYRDGDTNSDFFHITDENKFTAYHPNGIVDDRGYVKREFDAEINNYIYRMYRNSGELYQSFGDDGEKEKTDIFMGSSGTPHYVKLYGEGGIGDDGRGPEEIFVGSWNCERAFIDISYNGEGVFRAMIKWGGSADSSGLWEYPLVYDNGKLVCSGNGTLTHLQFKDAESAPTETVEYTDGAAEFTLEGDKLFWNDLKEHCADDMVFSRQ